MSRKQFVDFHYMSDKCFFIDVAEEEFLERKAVAKEILREMQHELKLPEEEILNYVKARDLFENKIKDLFLISERMVKQIRKAIENDLGQGRR